jgi:DNA-binding NarL/FixJ family response regulator
MIPSYTIAEGASYHGRDDLVARALAHADRIEARYEFNGPRAHGVAIRALDLYARGQLDRARAVIRRGMDALSLRAATAVLARYVPMLADALDDESLVTPEIIAEFAAARLHARHADDAVILGAAAFWALRRGQPARALTDLRRALAFVKRPIVHADGTVLLAAQHLPIAELSLLDAFVDPAARDTDDVLGRAHALMAAAVVARRRGDTAAATAAALEAADRYRDRGRPLNEAHALEHAGRTHAARDLYERCGAIGWARRLGATAASSGETKSALSTRELDVARLIADGLGNAAIGERLSISTKTVEKHVASIYDKLGVRSRAQVALFLSGARERAEAPSA